MSGGWESLFPTVQVYKISRECLDHNPLILVTKQLATIKQRPFRFKLTWLKDDECLHRVQKIWNEPTRDKVALDRVQFKLKKRSRGSLRAGVTTNLGRLERERWRLMRSS
jgi:phage antirepressor YoqD-like protein